MGKKKPTQRVTEYYTSVQYAICHGPVEKLVSLRVNEKIIGDCFELNGPVIYIDQPELFGGVKKEGGLRGRLAWQNGSNDQLIDPYVALKKGKTQTELPGYRGIATAFFTEWPAGTGYTEPMGLLKTIVRGSGVVVGSAIASIFGNLSRTNPKGFYWSANQPIIPPTHFRVTRIDRDWLPEIAAIAGDIDVSLKGQAICIAIDKSFTMVVGNRMASAKNAAAELLRHLKESPGSDKLDIRIVPFALAPAVMQFRNCTQENYDTMISYVLGINASNDKFYTNAMTGLADFYNGAGDKCRVFLMLTDGESADSANTTAAAEILLSTGARSSVFNIENDDITESGKMDTTPSDGVPVISEDASISYLGNLMRAAVTNQMDMNPAHIIRECLTNGVWGLGLPESSLDMPMFQAAAETLYEERFGLSMIWTRQAGVQEFIGEILSHIQGVVYVNPMTGKISLRLIRNDYDASTLAVLTPSNSTVTSFKRRTPAEVTSEIAVTWINPTTEKEEVVTIQSLGSIVANNGEIVSDNRNYYGVRRARLAADLAARDLAASTAPLSTAEVMANRKFSRIVPGDVVKLTDPENGADQLIMRVMKVGYGRPGDSEVQLTLTEDVFSFAKPRVVQPFSTLNERQERAPTVPSFVEIITLNPFLYQTTGDGIDDLAEPQTQVAFFIATDNSDTFNVEVFEEETGFTGVPQFESLGDFDTVSRGFLSQPLVQEAVSVTVLPAGSKGAQPKIGGFVLIGPTGIPEATHEIALITDFDDITGEWTLTRAVIDTVPGDWPAGTPVRYFEVTTRMVSQNADVSGVPTDYRFQPRTSLGVLDGDVAPIITYTPTDRLIAPARPANVTVAGQAFGDLDATLLTSIDVTWANRNRLTEEATVLRWDEGTVAAEPGQTTVIQLINYDTGFFITEIDGLTGTSHTFPASARGSADTLLVRVISRRDGYDSIQGHGVVLQFPVTARLTEEDGDQRMTETGEGRRTED